MKKILFGLAIVSLVNIHSFAQADIHFTNPLISDVLSGNYNPLDYAATEVIDDPEIISTALLQHINPDSLKNLLLEMRTFENRNTGSDTVSLTRGIGAARTWVLNKFNSYSAANENRLLTGYLQFDQEVCDVTRHKNIVAVLPGRDATDPAPIIIEGHIDSRCADVCDIECSAEGMEDNGSGTALVMELARVMSRFTFDHTIIFMATIGEEQGLVGAYAFATHAVHEDIPIKAVLNNDIVGGILCGETSSPPSCPGLNNVDSTQVRLFSYGSFNSPHKALARFIKLEYDEMLRNKSDVPMMLTIMSAEDRTGRGGDHIPFRQNGFPAMRFTSANEHGNADVSDPEYHDRQHTSDDILGVDTDGDQEIDSFFVNFNYLARNAAINANAAAMAASGPDAPSIYSVGQDGDFLYIEIEDTLDYNHYVVGLRVNTHDFDTLYYIEGGKSGVFELPSRELNIFISSASIDEKGVESLFSEEKLVKLTAINEPDQKEAVELLQNKPNPFDESTTISFIINDPSSIREASIVITDMNGKKVKELPVEIREGLNEVLFTHGYNMTGAYFYSLVINGAIAATKKMVFAN